MTKIASVYKVMGSMKYVHMDNKRREYEINEYVECFSEEEAKEIVKQKHMPLPVEIHSVEEYIKK